MVREVLWYTENKRNILNSAVVELIDRFHKNDYDANILKKWIDDGHIKVELSCN